METELQKLKKIRWAYIGKYTSIINTIDGLIEWLESKEGEKDEQ